MNKRILFSILIIFAVSVSLLGQRQAMFCPRLESTFLDAKLADNYQAVYDQLSLLDTYTCSELATVLSAANSVKIEAAKTQNLFDFDDNMVDQCKAITACMDSVFLPFIYSKCPELNPFAPKTQKTEQQSTASEKPQPAVDLSRLDYTRLDEVAGALRAVKPEIYDSASTLQDSIISRSRLFTNLAISDHFTDNLAERRKLIVEGKVKEINLLWDTNTRWADSLITFEWLVDSLRFEVLQKDIRIKELELFRVKAKRSITYPDMNAFMIIHANMSGFYYDPEFMVIGADGRIRSKDFFGVPFDIYGRFNGQNAVNRALDKNLILQVPIDLNLSWSVFSLNRVIPGVQYHSKSFYNPEIPAPYDVHPRQVTANDVFRFAPWEVGLESSVWQFDLSAYTAQYHIDQDNIAASTASLKFRFPADTSDGQSAPRARKDGEYERLWSIETFATFTEDVADRLPYGGKHNTYFGIGGSNASHSLIYGRNIQSRMLGRPDFSVLELFPLPLDRVMVGLWGYFGTKHYNEEAGIDLIVGTKPLLIRLSTFCDANSKWLSTNISPRLTHVNIVPERVGELEVWWLRDFFPIGLEVSVPNNTAFPYEVRLSTFMNIRR